MISFKDLYKEDLQKATKKMKQPKVSTKKPKKIEKLMETTDELLTPYWFWPHYIDNNLVPKSLAESIIKGSDPGLSPLSHSSKLSVLDTSSGSTVSISNRKAFSPCAAPPILVNESPDNTFYDIMVITRQRRSRVSENAFNIDEYLGRKPKDECESPLDMFRRFNPTVPENQGNRKQKSVTTKPKTVPSSPLDMNPFLESMLNIHDFEMIWKRKGDNLEISRAEGLMKLLGRALSPAEILLESVKNLWHDDLEIQIESKFFHVDRYIFTYYATNFRDMRGSFLQFPVCKIGMELVMELYDWMPNFWESAPWRTNIGPHLRCPVMLVFGNRMPFILIC
ncbi:uncharacterized protein Dana_GF21791, isoform B [Drosophila ananassae]|uniref:Uncharacterized protein, isoform B n=1 Tax=Drosophila ananassae TaxID=7217 RepID=A0A0P8Y7E9_DROAN|nr:uncharacterized protein LOC6504462 isoform X2 [Drosophila ananassae]KPU77349.1 uncharacterized protein Dana_GF21791, isoform B [Drosophila ananassae]